jgi:glycolate oxidase FAD binding subunit
VPGNVCRIDDFNLSAVFRPSSVTEVGDLVRRAAAEGQAIYPLGGRTMLGLGLPPTRPGIGIELGDLAQVIDYPARDMTVTVQAGITFAKLQRLLATENQRLPIDVPRPEEATLGGALAANVSGPRRYGSGTLRDYVIGITTVNDEGQETKAGGRVVKNVAGYDLCKLHVGALGTLGIITQVTLKLRPLPAEKAIVTLGCGSEALEPLLDQLHETHTRPGCLDVLNGPAARIVSREAGVALPESPWVIVVGYEDNAEAIRWQMGRLIEELPAGKVIGLEARAGAATESLWKALCEFPGRPAELSFKANVLPSASAGLCRQLASWPEELSVHAHAGNGIVRGHLNGPLTLPRVRAMLEELHETTAAAQGNVILTACPPEWKQSLPVWGRPRSDAWLMRQVKDKLDPRRLFNPGRYVTGD